MFYIHCSYQIVRLNMITKQILFNKETKKQKTDMKKQKQIVAHFFNYSLTEAYLNLNLDAFSKIQKSKIISKWLSNIIK